MRSYFHVTILKHFGVQSPDPIGPIGMEFLCDDKLPLTRVPLWHCLFEAIFLLGCCAAFQRNLQCLQIPRCSEPNYFQEMCVSS